MTEGAEAKGETAGGAGPGGDSRRVPGPVVLAGLAPLAVAGLYLLFLGHRSDYPGHFLAGFGATLGMQGICLLLCPRRLVAAWVGPIAIGGAIACVGGGACLEGTVFRYSIFDPIDFFNQSLGAAFAGLAFLSAAGAGRPSTPVLRAGVLLAFATLAAGFFYAFR